jgi:hypothetical protein
VIQKLNKLFFQKSQLDVSNILFFNDFIAGEDIYFSLGNASFNYKLKSDMGNFDKIVLANSLIDIVL